MLEAALKEAIMGLKEAGINFVSGLPDGFEDKYRFVRYIERLEGKQILQLARQDRSVRQAEQRTDRAAGPGHL